MQSKDSVMKHNIPKLAADGSNWVIYHNCLLWVLDTTAHTDHLVHSTTPTSYITASDIGGLTPSQQWQKEEGMVKQIIGTAIPNIAFNCIKGHSAVKDVWAAIKKMYKERTRILMADMMQHFCNKHCGDSENMCTHFEELSQLQDQLAEMGKDIDNKNYVDVLMSLLPPSYDTAHSSVNVSAHLMQSKITSDTFQAYILNKYELHKLRSNKKDSKDEAFTADASKKKTKKDIECHNCHKHGHVNAGCWEKGGRREGQRPKCNDHANTSMAAAEEPELGAWAAIQNVEDKTNNNQRNYAAAIAGRSPAHVEQLCGAAELYNSGASQHMSPFCEHFITYQSIPLCAITTADKRTFYVIGTGDLQIEVPNGQSTTKVLL